jgi:hypothetical protein
VSRLLAFLVVLGGTAVAAAAEPAIHVFAVFCNAYPGKSGAINQSVSTDRLLIRELFHEHIPARGWGVRLRFLETEGAEARRDVIRDRFAAWSRDVRPEDTVFVYFSGHGAILDRAAGTQFLQTCDLQLVNRDDWAADITALPARLKIFVTDCCSTYPPEAVLAEGEPDVVPWETLYFLFLRHEGFVNLTAASPGQAAYGTQFGGYLTVNLHSDMQRHRTWEEVFRATQARVEEETAAEARAPGRAGMVPQRPLAHSLARAVDTGPDGARALPVTVEYVFPDSDRRRLDPAEAEALGLQQLYFARNEILARHGYDFSTPLLRSYFSSRSWYTPRPGMKTPPLSETESANLALISRVEKEFGGPLLAPAADSPEPSARSLTPDATPAEPDIFPFSSERALPRTAVQSLGLRELALARNEIFARHGYPFQSPALRDHFARKPWYRPDPAATQPELNAIEKQNLWLIEKIERIKGGPFRF